MLYSPEVCSSLKMAASSVCKQEIYWVVKRSQTEPSCPLSPLRIVRFPPSASVLLHLLQFPKTARCFLTNEVKRKWIIYILIGSSVLIFFNSVKKIVDFTDMS